MLQPHRLRGIVRVRFCRLAALAASVAPLVSVANPRSAGAESPATAPAAASNQLFGDSSIKSFGRFNVEIIGRGPDLIFIPGLGCSREVWHHTADHLREHYTLHLLQLAGFAGEPARDNAHGPVLDPVVEAIDKYISDNKLAPAVVIGHSVGGTIALRLAQQHPSDVSKLLIVDSLPFYSVLFGGPNATSDSVKPTAASFQKQTSAPLTDASRTKSKATIQQMVTADVDVDRIASWSAASDRAILGQTLYDDMMLDMRPGLGTMTMPVTLIYPFNAKLGVPLAAWDSLYQSQFAALPQKTLVRVDDSKHFVMYDQPEKFAAALDAFLRDSK